jgi:TatA/E family protein of Tat protein translocase
VSVGELLLMLAVVLLVLGPNRLPATGKLVGKGLRNFQRGLREARDAAGDQTTADMGPRTPRPTRLID